MNDDAEVWKDRWEDGKEVRGRGSEKLGIEGGGREEQRGDGEN